MIQFKAIKLTKRFYFLALLVISFLGLLIFFVISYTNKTVTTLSYYKTEQPKANFQNPVVYWVRQLSPEALKMIINSGIPVIEASLEAEPGGSNGIVIAALKAAFNIDIEDPVTILLSQIPMLSRVTAAFTPKPPPLLEVPSEDPDELRQEDTIDNGEIRLPDPGEVVPQQPVVIHDMSKPVVLIYHTHTTESYDPSSDYRYTLSDSSYHCSDLEFSVARVGRELKSELENVYKIPVVHDTTIHDEPSYMMSYANSMKTFQKNLKAHGSIKIALDIHRDAPFLDKQKSRDETTFEVDGEKAARVMLVVGTDRLFEHPGWRNNYMFALKVQDKMEKLYPGMARRIDVREERFNQHLLDRALLVEIGSQGNTMEEALLTARCFAKVIAEVIKE